MVPQPSTRLMSLVPRNIVKNQSDLQNPQTLEALNFCTRNFMKNHQNLNRLGINISPLSQWLVHHRWWSWHWVGSRGRWRQLLLTEEGQLVQEVLWDKWNQDQISLLLIDTHTGSHILRRREGVNQLINICDLRQITAGLDSITQNPRWCCSTSFWPTSSHTLTHKHTYTLIDEVVWRLLHCEVHSTEVNRV